MTNPAAEIDIDGARVTRTIRIQAPVPIVWDALTHPAQIGQWFGQQCVFPDGVQVGSSGHFLWNEHGAFPVRIEEYEPMTRFAFTWGATRDSQLRPGDSTVATFDLEPAEGNRAAVLTVTETGFGELSDPAEALRENASGWTEELNELVDYVAELMAGRPAAADAGQATIAGSIQIAAPQSVVWEALTSPDQIEAWWGHPAVFPDGMAVGQAGTFEVVGQGLCPLLITRWQPPWRWSFLWGEIGTDSIGADSSLIEFTVVGSEPDQTIVTVVETLPAQGADAAPEDAAGADEAGSSQVQDNISGWNFVLNALYRHLAPASSGP